MKIKPHAIRLMNFIDTFSVHYRDITVIMYCKLSGFTSLS
jgi:hypothetical protein